MEKLGSMEQELHPLVLELTLHGASLCQQVDKFMKVRKFCGDSFLLLFFLPFKLNRTNRFSF